MSGGFRQYLFPHDHPRLAGVRGMDVYRYREHSRIPGTFTGGLVEGWEPLYHSEFRGITADGTVEPGLHPLTPPEPGEAAAVAAMLDAATALLGLLDDAGRARLSHPVDAPEWQTWANPEFLQLDTGLRLEHQRADVVEAALDLVRASLSPEGWRLVHGMMLVNGFLGEVVDLPTVLGELSYNVALYGTPDPVAPWGWQLFGHHCAVHCLVVGGRMALGPVFLGSEPDRIDTGPHAGPSYFAGRIDLGRAVMAALPAEQQRRAVVYEQLVDPAMPSGRVHPGDERHLGGAFQDNRVIPPEGIPVSDMPSTAVDAVLALLADFLVMLPAGPRAARMREVHAELDRTWFSWIGGTGPDDVYYARVQSPVIMAEIDHHCGVFLDYRTPQPFHVHTVLRTPNGNDYGRDWVRQWQAARP